MNAQERGQMTMARGFSKLDLSSGLNPDLNSLTGGLGIGNKAKGDGTTLNKLMSKKKVAATKATQTVTSFLYKLDFDSFRTSWTKNRLMSLLKSRRNT